MIPRMVVKKIMISHAALFDITGKRCELVGPHLKTSCGFHQEEKKSPQINVIDALIDCLTEWCEGKSGYLLLQQSRWAIKKAKEKSDVQS